METKNIILPLFEGFYWTMHEFNDDLLIENFSEDIETAYNNDDLNNISSEIPKKEKTALIKNQGSYNDYYELFFKYYDIDYSWYTNDYAKAYCTEFDAEFGSIYPLIGIEKIKFDKSQSPKYYNYSNDSILVNISYNMDIMKQYLINNKEAFSEYIKDENTSYDGFFAYLSNDFDEYIAVDDFKESQVTQILDFCIKNEYWDNELQETLLDIAQELQIYGGDYIIDDI